MQTLPSKKSVWGARRREMEAWTLAQHPDRVVELLAAREWGQLVPFADAVAADVPIALAATDPALYRTLRKALTEIHVRGLALNPKTLRRLAHG